jgi:signal transduction histidine kinase
MSNPPFSHISRMQECAGALLDGTPGPLNDEQKELLRIIRDHCIDMVPQVELIVSLSHNFPSEQMAEALLHDLNTVLTPIIGYSELLYAGVVGALTTDQRISLEAILVLADRVQAWAYATFDFPLTG